MNKKRQPWDFSDIFRGFTFQGIWISFELLEYFYEKCNFFLRMIEIKELTDEIEFLKFCIDIDEISRFFGSNILNSSFIKLLKKHIKKKK